MNKFQTVAPWLATICLIAGCASTPPAKTPLELQAFQRKEFSTTKKVGFASTISVFQDLGYIVRAADIETGLITANSPTRSFVSSGSHMSSTEATAFIEELRTNRTFIRLNFVRTDESSSGSGMKRKTDTPIEDPKLYENAFQRIQEAIFVRTATN